MPAFLRRKSAPPANPHPHLPDTPPSLPPLILSTSLADPDPDARAPPLPPAASPPVIPTPGPEYLLDDLWDPWCTYGPRVDCPRRAATARSPHPPLPADPSQRISDGSTHPCPVATAATARVPSIPHLSYPKSDLGNGPLPSSSTLLARPSSPPVLRGHHHSPSNFDFEESLSAANVSSVVNQFRAYRAPPPQMAAQHPLPNAPHRHHSKPGSSSSLSSSSHNTDATRRTDGSCTTATSTSSVPSFTKVTDVSTNQLPARLDPVGSRDNSSPNVPPSSVPPRPRGPAVDLLSAVTSPTSRPLTTLNASTRARRAPAPPSSYSDRVRTLARQTSQPNLSPSPEQPMLFDLLRSGNQGSSCPLRKGPLIFAAMSATSPPSTLLNKTPLASPSDGNLRKPYPSSPAEYSLPEATAPTRSKASVSSILKRSSQVHEDPVADVRPLAHKSSKSSLRAAAERTPSTSSRVDAFSEHSRPRVLTKSRPTTPQKAGMHTSCVSLPEHGDSLLLGEDPFARTEGVRMLKPRTLSSSRSRTPSLSREDGSSEDGHVKTPSTPPPPLPKVPDAAVVSDTPFVPDQSPLMPDDYKTARQQRRGQWLEKAPPPAVAEVARQLSMEEEAEPVEEPPREPTPAPVYFPITSFMENANLLPMLLSCLSYPDWLALYSANKQIRELFQNRILRELVLERFLGTVGYSKWDYEWAEPVELSTKDLHNYLRGVAMPSHEYARLSAAYLQPKAASRSAPTSVTPDILTLALTTRAYTRVVLRLRAQAESEAKYIKTLQAAEPNHARKGSHPGTRRPSVSSRTPSPTSSHFQAGHHAYGENKRSASTSSVVSRFKSPLYRPGRVPVLRVFVPSPEGEWLSDSSVVECEAELKRSGVLKLLRVGDVVWDVAVGDEGNLGRLMWDGSYLVDLDYRYSRVGELSPYFHSLAFSPSYFHRVIRIGGSATHNPHCNPIVYIDVSAWGHEIATNLQLLQDRARTETPHGALHDVVRWVHRSTFTIRPPSNSKGQSHTRSRSARVPIPNGDGLFVDPGWYGTVVIEAEGTNEGLVDLQTRCGPGVFPPRAESLATKIRNEKEKENRRVWRILREKSRPGEIWLRAVQVQERLM